MEHLEKYLTWFTPLVSSMAAIIFAAEEQIDKRGPGAGNLILFRVFYASNYYEVFCKLNVVDFEGKKYGWIELKITNWFPLVRLLHVPPEKKPRSQLKSRFTIFGKIIIESFSGSNKMLNSHWSSFTN